MKLDLRQVREITRGAVRVTQEEDGFHFYRFTSRQEELYKNRSEKFYKRTFSTSGIQLAFKTNSEHLFLKIAVSSGCSRQYFALEVFSDEKPLGAICNFNEAELPCNYANISLPLGTYEKDFSLGAGEKELRIYLPWSVKTTMEEIVLDDGAFIVPVKKKHTLLAFGDSITHGYDALYPSNKYISQLADALDAEEFNKAIGGEIFFPELAGEKDDFSPDYLTVAYGSNDWNRCTEGEFRNNCRDFFANLVAQYPTSKIFVITPTWRKDLEEERVFGRFEKTDEIIKNTVKDFENIVAISGFDLVAHDERFFADLRLHPNDEGFKQYFNSLAKYIIK